MVTTNLSNIDYMMVQQTLNERRQQAAHERLARQRLVNKTPTYTRLLAKVGDLLITCGAGLKTSPQQKFV